MNSAFSRIKYIFCFTWEVSLLILYDIGFSLAPHSCSSRLLLIRVLLSIFIYLIKLSIVRAVRVFITTWTICESFDKSHIWNNDTETNILKSIWIPYIKTELYCLRILCNRNWERVILESWECSIVISATNLELIFVFLFEFAEITP